MKPDFNLMSKEELKAYVLAHKSDTEAFHKLADRLKADNQNSLWHPYPTSHEELLIMERAIQEKVKKVSE